MLLSDASHHAEEDRRRLFHLMVGVPVEYFLFDLSFVLIWIMFFFSKKNHLIWIWISLHALLFNSFCGDSTLYVIEIFFKWEKNCCKDQHWDEKPKILKNHIFFKKKTTKSNAVDENCKCLFSHTFPLLVETRQSRSRFTFVRNSNFFFFLRNIKLWLTLSSFSLFFGKFFVSLLFSTTSTTCFSLDFFLKKKIRKQTTKKQTKTKN